MNLTNEHIVELIEVKVQICAEMAIRCDLNSFVANESAHPEKFHSK